ncbi:PepSY domain-containing protein [Arthrobacter sp. AZCC_0090]|uniref:PepSY-associated TM helix domain-containing protein n=1 Tax=Arthrobacter sp. AZCC_0090 TaxID=2735881 RepID=UPI00161A6D00|nr:PepSY-associated TM helix domain-containing protein [Arthrobacter sp. AZCC_0090]MBB6404767.1 putative iron-regulated membrane protein [Arthrobacter sp. AZCC_0090]
MTLLTKPPAGARSTPLTTGPDTALPSADPGWFRPFLLRIHFYAGILAGPFLLIAAITGGLYAMTPSLEPAIYARELHVPAVAHPLPLAAQVKAAVDRVGGAAPVTVRPAPGPEDTTRVLFTDPTLGDSQYRTLFVDPATADIRGDLPTYGSSGAMPLRTFIDNLHRSLGLGEPGRVYSELAASWLWVIALGGLILWIDRIRRRRAAGKTKAVAAKARPRSGRARLVWLHGTTGTVLLVAFVFLSATGLTWSASAGANIGSLRTALGWATPTISTALTGPATAPAGEHAGHSTGASPTAAPAIDPAVYDTAARIARADIITAPMIDIKPPAKPGKAWTVTEAGREWPGTASAVAIDPSTGTITSRADFNNFSLPAKLTRWTIAAHMGLLFGLPNQLLLLAVAVGLAAMVVWGYVMWWKRRPTRGSAWAFGRPAPRGAFLRAHWAGVLAALTVMVALGLLLPLLGWSLLAFIILDTVIGVVKRRRSRLSATPLAGASDVTGAATLR